MVTPPTPESAPLLPADEGGPASFVDAPAVASTAGANDPFGIGPLTPLKAAALVIGLLMLAPSILTLSVPVELDEGWAVAVEPAAFLAVPLILLRHRHTRWMTYLAIVATAGSVAILQTATPLVLALLLLIYTLAADPTEDTARLWRAAITAIVVVGGVMAWRLVVPDANSVELAAGFAVWTGAVASAGIVVRTRLAYVQLLEARARAAEETRLLEARRAVAEERLHIARELHDVLAHRIAVINVQAGAAGVLVPRNPEAAVAALGEVRNAAATVLTELGGVLNVLRGGDPTNPPTGPAPGLTELPELVASFGATGLSVDVVDPPSPLPSDLPSVVQLTVYRVVGEALTNAHRHGDGRARLQIWATPGTIEVSVVNRPASEPAVSPGSGLGLMGMAERVAAVRGRLGAGVVDDPELGRVFHVRASIPVPSTVFGSAQVVTDPQPDPTAVRDGAPVATAPGADGDPTGAPVAGAGGSGAPS